MTARLGRGVACGLAVSLSAWAPAIAETLSPLQPPVATADRSQALTAVAVDFPPGDRARPHRHGEAVVFAYVLRGEVRSQIEGEPARTYRAGESWVERPGAHHVLTDNQSRTRPARLLVVFAAPSGAPLKSDDPSPDANFGGKAQ